MKGKSAVGSLVMASTGESVALTWNDAPRPALDLVAVTALAARTKVVLEGERGLDPGGTRALVEGLGALVPAELQVALRVWSSEASAPLLLVQCPPGSALEDLPWELLPTVLGDPRLFVARLAPGPMPPRKSTGGRSLLAGVWYGEAQRLRREMVTLERLAPALDVKVRLNAPVEAFEIALREQAPRILHLLGNHVEGGVALVPEAAGVLDAGRVIGLFQALPSPWLVMMNTCFGGRTMAAEIARKLGSITVAWAGWISIATAAAFAEHLYRHLLAGSGVVGAVRAFEERHGRDADDDAPIPMVWLPSAEAADAPLEAVAAPDYEIYQGVTRSMRGTPLGGHEAFSYESAGARDGALRGVSEARRAGGDDVRIDVRVVPAICPALLKNGRPIFDPATVTVARPRRLRLEILCDAGAGTSAYRRMIDVSPESRQVSLSGVQFPVLYQLIEQEKGRRRFVSFSITLSEGGHVLDELTLSSLLLCADEWVDQPELWSYVPAFVRPQAKGLADLEREAEKVLDNIETGAKLTGYAFGVPGAASQQIKALFKALATQVNVSYRMPLGGRTRVPGQHEMAVQIVRSPAEILETHAGTCHDLTLLLASCAERATIHPLVILVPGHTFFGFWTTAQHQETYWKTRWQYANPGADRYDGSWLITETAELRSLVAAQKVIVVEATEITGGKKFDEAMKIANDRIKKPDFQLDAAVDVARSRAVVQPL